MAWARSGGTWSLDQDRTHNAVNEITDLSVWIDPVYDAAGNMTTMPKPIFAFTPSSSFTLVYDAWNRLVEVKDGANTVQTNEFDGLGRRIVRVDVGASDTYDNYYNEQWQLLEERKDGDGDPLNQFTWHPYYIDALAVRWYDADTDANLAENADGDYYNLQDANFNVTAIANSSGVVVERGHYHPYGVFRILNGDTDPDGSPWGIDPGEVSDVGNTHWYTGRERDPETGLQLNRKRFYASHLGRWVTQDPIDYEGSEWNLYEYNGGNPIVHVDPQGLGPLDDARKDGRNPRSYQGIASIVAKSSTQALWRIFSIMSVIRSVEKIEETILLVQ